MIEPYYQEDGITIYNTECENVLPYIQADILITDPPYPNNAGYFIDDIEPAKKVIAGWRGKEALIFWSELEHPPCELPLVAVHIWHRTNVNGRPYEPIYHYHVDGRKRRSDVGRFPAVFDGAGPGCNEYLGHPTQKSRPLMLWLIQKTSNGVIVDPYCGVGTTLLAAKQAGRRAIGIEANQKYCELAVKKRLNRPIPLFEQGGRTMESFFATSEEGEARHQA
jgi:site-specific DNA-methyltransferase (adenine-specific)